ncbi:FAD-dependent oxidoreductase [Novosphingobium sp. 9U]|uniref:FAD-dependent oxidoreductase n=1 Tax=Novosphingobium sp. 9U TaxID=2653158 RepID=UPI0012F0BEB2|nr:FAD-dependent oxidoreductase [Novosphingobium sp. 9U]VWX50035.1 putative 3-oxosteroid 1-dehydrogenase [Novosphingobium sp. 9U]
MSKQPAVEAEYDVVVVGSGVAGLTAAVVAAKQGLKVLVAEKAELFGGTTAFSSGGAWIPNNPYMASVGQHDTPEEAYTYLRATLGNSYDTDLVEAFVETGPEMLKFMDEKTKVRFYPVLLPDYHPGEPGAKAARTIIAEAFNGRELGDYIRHVRNPLPGYVAFGSFQTDMQHVPKLTSAFRTWEGFRFSAKRMAGFVRDVVTYGKGTHMAHGNALVGRLMRTALDAGVTLRRDTPAVRLDESDGRVVGIVLEIGGQQRTIGVRNGVVLASGGFGANLEMRAKYIPLAEDHLSAQPAENVGDGIRMGQGAGGVFAEPNISNGIWAPCSAHRAKDGTIKSVFPHFGPDRGKPGTIIVDTEGRRIGNEASPYQEFVSHMNASGIRKAWFIGTKVALRKYGMGVAMPAPLPYRHLVRDGYLIEAGTIPGLAHKLGIPKANFEQTIARFNEFAARGEDPDFGRGSNSYDNAQGDFNHTPNPNLAPLDRGPFYAIEIHPGDCSTTLGLKTTPDGQVLNAESQPVPGLFAVGLDMNSLMYGRYPGGGSSIGPALVFGYRAGRKLAA